jgi:GDPmannose 4,6-dehydratase
MVKPGHDADDISRLKQYALGIQVVECDLRNQDELVRLVRDFEPHEVFNFGGISSIVESIRAPELTHEVNVGSVVALVAGMREFASTNSGIMPRLVTAASGTIFEGADRSPQNEDTEPSPQSPYAQSKGEVISMLRRAREEEGLFVTSAILYNHESPLRGEGFVTRKISMAVARISAGIQNRLELGDIEVARDWGWAPDYVRAMQLMVAADSPHDYVLASGISHRLSFFIDRAFAAAGILNWSDLVVSTEVNQRKVDTNLLVGDSRRAYLELGWRHTVDFDSMAAAMVKFDQDLLADPEAIWDSRFVD